MTQVDPGIGIYTGGKPINLAQLEDELAAAGLAPPSGLGLGTDADQAVVFTYDENGVPSEFDPEQEAAIQAILDAHVAMRDKTNDEYAAEFDAPGTTPERQRRINAIMNTLFPRDQVPV